jgi:N-acetylneuraminic acid mutarotase
MALKALQGLVGFLVVALVGCGPQQPEGASPSTGTVRQALAAWTATGTMSGRHSHTETVLPSGKVLVVGGRSSSTYLNTAQLYDPALGTWSSAGTMTDAREDHTATLLSNGTVAIVGGYNSSSGTLDTVEIYDPATNTWSPTGTLLTGRAGHRAVEVTTASGAQLMVMGGYDSSSELDSSELYDASLGTWSSAGTMGTARSVFGAVVLSSGKVLVAGGSSFFSVTDSTEEYDPSTNTWSSVGILGANRTGHTMTLLGSGMVLVTGGWHLGSGGYSGLDSAERYDPSTQAWSAAGSMPYDTNYTNNGRVNHAAVKLSSGVVLVAGGNGNSVNRSTVLYDPSTNTWSASVNTNNARQYHTLSLLSSGDVLAAGGNYSSTTSELYTP